jgi:hypothetical protein
VAAFGIEDATWVDPKSPADNPAVLLFDTGGAAGSTDDASTLLAAILLNTEGADGAWVDPGDGAGFIFWVTCGAPLRVTAFSVEEEETEADPMTPADDPAVLSLVASGSGAADSTDDGCSAAGAKASCTAAESTTEDVTSAAPVVVSTFAFCFITGATVGAEGLSCRKDTSNTFDEGWSPREDPFDGYSAERSEEDATPPAPKEGRRNGKTSFWSTKGLVEDPIVGSEAPADVETMSFEGSFVG